MRRENLSTIVSRVPWLHLWVVVTRCMVSPKIFPGGLLNWLRSRDPGGSVLRKLARAMVHGLLQLAIAPQRFPGGRPVFSACLAGACGFARADSAQGERRCSSRKLSPLLRSGLATSQNVETQFASCSEVTGLPSSPGHIPGLSD